MPKIPVLKPQEVVKILSALGFEGSGNAAHINSSGTTYGRATTVPFHKGRDVSLVLLRQIAKDIGMTVEEMLEHR